MPKRSRSAVGMPRKCAIGTVKTTTASGRSALDEPLEVPLPARRDPAPDRLARELVERRLLRARPRRGADSGRPCSRASTSRTACVRLALAVGGVRRGPPPGRLDGSAAVGRHDEVDAGLVHPLPELPPRRRAAVAEVEVDRGGDGEDLRRLHARSLAERAGSEPEPPPRRARRPEMASCAMIEMSSQIDQFSR